MGSEPEKVDVESGVEQLTLDEARAALLSGNLLDPQDPTDLEAGLVLMGGLAVGPHTAAVAKWMGVPFSRVQKYARNLRRCGVWRRDGKTYAQWDQSDEGVVAFVLDLLVAKGLVERKGDDFVYNPRGRKPKFSSPGC